MCHVISGNYNTFIAYYFFGTQSAILARILFERCAFICVSVYKLLSGKLSVALKSCFCNFGFKLICDVKMDYLSRNE